MATTNEPQPKLAWSKPKRSWAQRDRAFRFTIKQFYQLGELGFFDNRHVELIEGIVYEMTIYPEHSTSSFYSACVLGSIFGEGWYIRQAQPIDLGSRSLIEPDIAVVVGSASDYAHSQPRTSTLVVEVSDSTLRKDRNLKAIVYAKAGLPEYWIVNLVDRQLEVHREPGADPDRKGRFRYASVTIVAESGRVSPLAAPDSVVPVSDLLP